MQSRGQWGARDFDKLMFELPIPLFDSKNALHKEIAQASKRASRVAAKVDIAGLFFTRARSLIREAVRKDGVAQEIERLIQRLLE